MIHELYNLRFKARSYRPNDPDNDVWLIDVERISDEHWLKPQVWLDHEPTAAEMAQLANEWILEHGDQSPEPPAVHCLACGTRLKSDFDTPYGFDNALWIGFHGGYGMFVDACDFPTNTADQWLRAEDGEYLLMDGQPVEDPDWEPEWREPRVLPGRPDLEAVICHECAHELCDQVPWINKLLNPIRSHAHRVHDHPRLLAQGHRGWDLDRVRGQLPED